MTATKTKAARCVQMIGRLDLEGHPPTYALIVDGKSMWVRDRADRFGRFECATAGSEPHTVYTRAAVAVSCDCKDKLYRGGICRHMAAVSAVAETW